MREDVTATPLRMNTPLRTIGTPSHDPWNPAVPNTPRADTPRSWVDDDNPGAWTPGSTHSDYSVGTPSQAYPAYSPYSPAPPSDHSRHTHDSSMYNPSTPSPYSSVNTPGTGYTPSSTNYSDHPTPSESTPRTPYSTSTPSTPLTPSTPGVPATPATPSTPSTPGVTPDSYESGTPYDDSGLGMGQGSAYESDMSRPWPEPDIEVKYSSGRGIVKEVHTDGTSVVAMLDRPDTMPAVPVEALEPVVPSKKDRLKVIRGEFKGNSGVLIGVYGNDGIVKMDSNLDIKILPMNHIAKLAQ
jgi:transcription elongation factor SPT5